MGLGLGLGHLRRRDELVVQRHEVAATRGVRGLERRPHGHHAALAQKLQAAVLGGEGDVVHQVAGHRVVVHVAVLTQIRVVPEIAQNLREVTRRGLRAMAKVGILVRWVRAGVCPAHTGHAFRRRCILHVHVQFSADDDDSAARFIFAHGCDMRLKVQRPEEKKPAGGAEWPFAVQMGSMN